MQGILVLCLSLFLNWIPLAALGLILFDYAHGLIYSSLLVVAAGIFVMSPAGEIIVRISSGCRPATRDEWQKMEPAWESVLSAIGQTLESRAGERFANIKLFVRDDKFPDAFTLGNNTVCLTKGLLNISSTEDIAGVLAHEAGHLHFGDSQRLSVVLTASGLGIASYRILDLFCMILESMASGVAGTMRQPMGSGGIFGAVMSLLAGLAMIAASIASIILRMASIAFKAVIDLGMGAVGRSEEFRADLFAGNIGFGQQLAKFLRRIEAMDPVPKGIRAVLQRSHPPVAVRIDRLLQSGNQIC